MFPGRILFPHLYGSWNLLRSVALDASFSCNSTQTILSRRHFGIRCIISGNTSSCTRNLGKVPGTNPFGPDLLSSESGYFKITTWIYFHLKTDIILPFTLKRLTVTIKFCRRNNNYLSFSKVQTLRQSFYSLSSLVSSSYRPQICISGRVLSSLCSVCESM